MKITNIPYINESELISEFENLTGWSSDRYGSWNSDKTKYCFAIGRHDQTLQNEQDWVCLYCPNECENVTRDKSSLLNEDHVIGIAEMLQFLILNKELEEKSFFYVGTDRF